jgi:hypothetical protein
MKASRIRAPLKYWVRTEPIWAPTAAPVCITKAMKIYPWASLTEALKQTGRESERVRDLPAEVVTYYVMSLGLFMAVSTREVLRVLVEGLQWMGAAGPAQPIRVASKAAISQARTRLGAAPLKQLWEQTAQPPARAESAGAFYRGPWYTPLAARSPSPALLSWDCDSAANSSGMAAAPCPATT